MLWEELPNYSFYTGANCTCTQISLFGRDVWHYLLFSFPCVSWAPIAQMLPSFPFRAQFCRGLPGLLVLVRKHGSSRDISGECSVGLRGRVGMWFEGGLLWCVCFIKRSNMLNVPSICSFCLLGPHMRKRSRVLKCGRLVREADNLSAIYKPIVWTVRDP
jgi:hypothetical protein